MTRVRMVDIKTVESVDVSVPATAPSSAWTYGEIWQINAIGTVGREFWMIMNGSQ